MRSSFLLASRRVPSVSQEKRGLLSRLANGDVLDEDDAEAATLEFDLAAAKEVSTSQRAALSPSQYHL